MDRLQVFEIDGEPKRRCVACGHEDDLSNTASQPPTNRLDGGLKKPDPEATRPVRILDPGGAES
jgi:Zn ribbon nucleic-acid-binding protein